VVYLFGSVARSSATRVSDVDVAVLYQQAPPRSLAGLPLDLEDDLERLLGRPVDVVVLNRAPVDLIHRVLRDGRLIAEADRAARIRFETRARSDYFDLLPTLLRYRRLEGSRG
jgi:predicted nucleotidyltransferase